MSDTIATFPSTSGEQTQATGQDAVTPTTVPLNDPSVLAQAAPVAPATPPAPVTPVSTRERLRARKVKRVTVDLGDGLLVEVRGLEGADAFELGGDFDELDEVTAAQATPPLLRSTCFDTETGEKIYDDSWTDAEINSQPIDVLTKLANAANVVMGRTGEPGKD